MGSVVGINALQAQPSSKPDHDKAYYLQKSKSQKTAGFMLLGGGVTAATLGIIWASNDARDNGIFNADFDAQLLVVTAGVLAAVGSIVLFVSSSHNHEKAMLFSAGFKATPLLDKSLLGSAQSINGMSLVVHF